MAWETAGAARLPRDWHKRRARVMRRDQRQCQFPRTDGGVCGQEATAVDHVTAFAEGGDDEEGNLRAICDAHHRRKSGEEAHRGRERHRPAPRRRAEEPHPGRRC
ncbi:HNH endonuclease [Actinomycetospora rhizophila]|uniref:HNH endonuclease n=1 Tax=Actinomycetospora rhizophila TaxID=1416876 RepID=A0ABV9ZIT6_9PSEU